MTTLKVKVGKLTLTEARDVRLPQEHAAWFETVRVEPGTYDVYVYLDWTGDGGGMYHIHSLSAQCEGVTTACYYGEGTRDRERVGKSCTAHIELTTHGSVYAECQASLDDVIEREVWNPRDHGSNTSTMGRMWRFNWRKDAVLVVDESAQPSYAHTKLARVVTPIADAPKHPRPTQGEILETLRATALQQLRTSGLLDVGGFHRYEANAIELIEGIVRNQAQIVNMWLEIAIEGE